MSLYTFHLAQVISMGKNDHDEQHDVCAKGRIRDEMPENDHTPVQMFSYIPNSTIKCFFNCLKRSGYLLWTLLRVVVREYEMSRCISS